MTEQDEPIVEAFLRAFAGQQLVEEGDAEPVDVHFAYAAYSGSERRILTCDIRGPRHAALAAILVGERLRLLIEQYEDGDQIKVDGQFRALVDRLSSAMGHLWQYLARHGGADLLPVARHLRVG